MKIMLDISIWCDMIRYDQHTTTNNKEEDMVHLDFSEMGVSPEISYILNETIDYLINVTMTQGRVLPFEDMWTGYSATIHPHFKKNSFKWVYDEELEILNDLVDGKITIET